MDRQYTRIDSVRAVLDAALKAIPDEEKKRCAYVHLYGQYPKQRTSEKRDLLL